VGTAAGATAHHENVEAGCLGRYREVTAADLFSLAISADFDLGENKKPHAQKIKFGKLLKARRDQVIGGYKITFAGESHAIAKWRLIRQRPNT
jgi:hypothetical protein